MSKKAKLCWHSCVLTSLVSGVVAQGWEYPETPERMEVLRYGVVQLEDGFSWLEADETAEAEAWFRAQDAYARGQIGAMPEREAIYERIKEIDEAKTVQVYDFARVGERYFYLKREVGQEVGILHYREGIDGAEQRLVDPAEYAESEVVHAFEFYSPSPDGRWVAFGIAPGGSEIPNVYVQEIATGQVLEAVIPRVRSGASWLADSSGFFYTQMRPIDPEEPVVDRYKRGKARLHRLGTAPEADPVVVSYDERPTPGLSPVDSVILYEDTGTGRLFAYVRHGVDRAFTLFMAKSGWREAITAIDWIPLCERAQRMESVAVNGEQIYFRTTLNAPRGKLLMGTLSETAPLALREIVGESDEVLTGIASLGGSIYVTAMAGGLDQFSRLIEEDGAHRLEPIALPTMGRVTVLANDEREADVYISLTSWVQAPAYYRYDPATGLVERSALRPLGPYDQPEGLIVERVMVPSHDGVEVPLTLIRHESTELDGDNPALLYGYGAYGISQRPAWGPTRLVWLERGGIYAVAHVRGGGEFGKAWHEAGLKSTKRNSWLDFNACAQYLMDNGYAGEGQVGGYAGSMGGVLVGRAMTSAPELYGAIVSSVGNHNPVRNHKRANGPANYPEYGNPLDPEEFPYVLAMDSYFAVRDGVVYPPTLLLAGYNDARVDPWMPGKMAARLQQASPEGGPFLLRVGFEAGHGGVARSDIWEESADLYTFLFWALQKR